MDKLTMRRFEQFQGKEIKRFFLSSDRRWIHIYLKKSEDVAFHRIRVSCTEGFLVLSEECKKMGSNKIDGICCGFTPKKRLSAES